MSDIFRTGPVSLGIVRMGVIGWGPVGSGAWMCRNGVSSIGIVIPELGLTPHLLSNINHGRLMEA